MNNLYPNIFGHLQKNYFTIAFKIFKKENRCSLLTREVKVENIY